MSGHDKAAILAYKKGYRITDDGKVLSPHGRILKLQIKNDGYYQFSIRGECRVHMRIKVAKLAAYQKFKNALFMPGVEIRHLNGNPKDNRLDNIAIGTHSENMMDSPEHIRIAKAHKGAAKVKRFTNAQAEEIRRLRDKGYKYLELCRIFNCAKSTISEIVNRKTYVGA